MWFPWVRRSYYALLACFFVCFTIVSFSNLYSLPWLIAAVGNFVLAEFIFTKNPKNEINRAYAFLGVCFALWMFDIFGLHMIKTESGAREWMRLFRPSYLFLAPTIFHFVMALSKNLNAKTWRLVHASYAIAALFSLAVLTGDFNDDVVWREYAYFPVMNRVSYILSLANIAFWAVLGFSYVFKTYRRTRSVREKKQLSLFLLVSVSAVGVIEVTHTLFGMGIRVYPMGGIVAILYSASLAYIIVKYQLMDIEVIVQKSIVYATLTLTVMALYGVTVAVFAGIFGSSEFVESHGRFANAFTGLVIALIAILLRDRVQQLVDRLFFREKYDYKNTLREFSNGLVSIIELDYLLELLVSKVVDTMHIARGYIMLRNEQGEFQIRFAQGMSLYARENALLLGGSAALQWFERTRSVALLENGAIPGFEEFVRQRIAVCLPIIIKEKVIGIFCLGYKLSEEMYSKEDIGLLSTLVNQAAVAIENDRLYTGIRTLEKGLHQTDKLSALGTFASSIAHEIKNPLTSIKTFCQLVARKNGDQKFVERFNAVVPQEIERMEFVLGQLLDFGKLTQIDFTSVRLEKVITDLLVLLHHEAFKHNVKIYKEFDGNIPAVKASEEQMKQVFMNLTLNAIQAMSQGGELFITTSRVRGPDGQDSAVISFRDTGCGIAPENMPRLFSPFFTTKQNGTGLGLSITRRIVQEHCGTIEVHSELNKGTVFIIKLPINECLVPFDDKESLSLA